MVRSWRIEGSNDGVTFTTLREHRNDTSIAAPLGSFTFRGVGDARRAVDIGYRFFRVIQIGPNARGSFYLNLSGMELYGLLFGTWGGGVQFVKTHPLLLRPYAPRLW
jgi:hypothetical protein